MLIFYSLVRSGVLMFPYAVFYKCYVPNSNLHSFPTRRSSDLHPSHLDWLCHLIIGLFWLSICTRILTRPVSKYSSTNRSEEHTSELQSRGHLVCRLLLE